MPFSQFHAHQHLKQVEELPGPGVIRAVGLSLPLISSSTAAAGESGHYTSPGQYNRLSLILMAEVWESQP